MDAASCPRRSTWASSASTAACVRFPACCRRFSRLPRGQSTSVVVPTRNRRRGRTRRRYRACSAPRQSRRGRAAGTAPTVEVPRSSPWRSPRHRGAVRRREPLDLADVIGQPEAVEALRRRRGGRAPPPDERAAGCGQDDAGAAASRHPAALDDDAALAAASIRSLCRRARRRRSPARRPSRLPHHTASVAALVGGGSRVIRPGAIARASEGVLFLDEAGEFPRRALDALRQPLETGRSPSIAPGDRIRSRPASSSCSRPIRARAATTACAGGACICPPQAIRRYLGSLSGPLLDRIDIELAMTACLVRKRRRRRQGRDDPASPANGCSRPRDRAARRLRSTPWRVNADVSGEWLRQGPVRHRRLRDDRWTPPCIAVPSRCAGTTGCCAWRGRSATWMLGMPRRCTTSVARST